MNRLSINLNKSSFLVFDRTADLGTIDVKTDYLNFTVTETKSHKYLGLIIDSQLKFTDHVDYIKAKVAKRIGALYRSKKLLPLKYRKMFINALMLPQFDYLDIIWCKTSKTNLKSLDVLYKKVAKIALDMDTREASIKVYCTMKWLPLHLRRQLHLSTYMYKILNNITPTTFLNKFVYVTGASRNVGKCNLFIPTSRSHKTLIFGSQMLECSARGHKKH